MPLTSPRATEHGALEPTLVSSADPPCRTPPSKKVTLFTAGVASHPLVASGPPSSWSVTSVGPPTKAPPSLLLPSPSVVPVRLPRLPLLPPLSVERDEDR
jgi:hypothetical protein